MQLRDATTADCAAINDIHNHYVINSTCTYQLEPETLEGRERWLADHDNLHPVIVAVEEGQVIGWGSLSAFHPRAAYGHSVETTVYIHPDHHRRGIGGTIVKELIARAKSLGHHTIIALISAEQVASIALHEKLGFARVGLLEEAGYKHNQWLDVVYMQLML